MQKHLPTKGALCEGRPSSALQWCGSLKRPLQSLSGIPPRLQSRAPGWQRHTEQLKKNCFHHSLRNVYQRAALEAYGVVSLLWVHERWTSGKSYDHRRPNGWLNMWVLLMYSASCFPPIRTKCIIISERSLFTPLFYFTHTNTHDFTLRCTERCT